MTDPYAPYEAPTIRSRGWRVGPTAHPLGLAAGSGVGLPVDLSVDVSLSMDLAVSGGDGLPFDLLYTPVANFDMLPAVGGDGDGLSAASTLSIPVTMDLADGSGGAALVPTLTVINPILFGALGGGGSAFANPGGLTFSWNHTKASSDNVVVVSMMAQTGDPYTSHSRSLGYGGATMTSAGVANYGFDSVNGVYVWQEWFYHLSPASGTQTVSVTLTNTSTLAQMAGNSLSYSNVGSIGSFSSQTGSASTASISVSSATNRVILLGTSCFQNISNGNQTTRDSNGSHYIQEAPGAASVSFTNDHVGTAGWAMGALQLVP